LSGEFRPYQVADLHARVSGYLHDIRVEIGAFVQAGQTLATLAVPEMEADVALSEADRQRSEAELTRARSDLTRAEADLELVNVSFTRLQSASKAEPGIVAQQEIDEARAREQVAQAHLASAQAAVAVSEHRIAAAKATEQRARTLAAYRTITAPFAGVITKRFVDPGAMIQAGTGSSAMPVVRLAEIARLRLVVNVPESAVPLVRVGDVLEVRVGSVNKTFPASVSRLTRDVVSASRTMEAEIDVPNPGNALTPGMYADVQVKLEQRDEGLTVPVTAVANAGGNRSVLVVGPNSILEERTITTGIETAASLEVLTGLREDDLVVVSVRSLLKPGQKVDARVAGGN
jgi:RND family efflux transporter MFP subunit